MNWLDYIVIVVVGVSAFLSGLKGCIREILGYVIWGGGLFFSAKHHPLVEPWLSSITHPQARTTVAFGAIFLSFLFMGSLFALLVDKIIKKTGFSSTNSVLGMFFGVFRGVFLIVLLVIYIEKFTQLSALEAWQESVLMPHLLELASYSMRLYTDSVAPLVQDLLNKFKK